MTVKNWFLVDGERMLLTEDEAEEYDEDGYDVVAENTLGAKHWQEIECTCTPTFEGGNLGEHVCSVCEEEMRQKRSEEIPYE